MPEPGSPRSTAVLVLGMHRSGTSALARVLNLLGVDLGEQLMPASADNASGFWEHQEIVLLHDRILEAAGSRWDDPRPVSADALLSDDTKALREELHGVVARDFAASRTWGLKDPRLCRLLPVWRPMLEEMGADARYLLTARDPREVAASLAKRDELPEPASRLLWLDHCLSAERDTRGAARSFLTYDALLRDWRANLLRIGRELGIDWERAIERAAPEIDAFLDPALRHHEEKAEAAGRQHPWITTTYRVWREAARGADPGPALAAVRDRRDAAGRIFNPWATDLLEEERRLRGLLRDRDAKIAKLRAGGASVENVAPPEIPAVAPEPVRETARPWTGRPGTKVVRTYEEPEGAPRVSIVMPLFDRVELTVRCLESVAEHTPEGLYEVVLVDNGCSDGTAELLDCLEGNVKVVRNGKNLGFATACNQGAEIASTENLLFLNNDMEAKAGWLEPMLRVLDADPSVAVVGSKLLFPDGTIQHAGVAMLHCEGQDVPLRAFHAHYGQSGDFREANVPAEYQVVTGACLLVRRGVFDQVGGFDTYFWNGCEDVDLCLKIGAAGWMIVYQPASCLLHHESQSGAERYSRVAGNEHLLCSRWLGKVEPDLIESADGNRRRTETHRIRRYDVPRSGEAAGPPPASFGDVAVSIIVLTRNQIEHTRACFDSLRRHTPEPHEIIFVDNGSTDGTVDWLRDVVRTYPPARVVAKSGNLGFAGGNNHGLSIARGRQVLLLNNDTIVTEGWLGGLMSVLDDHPDVGIVGPMTNRASGPQVVPDVTYGSVTEMERFAQRRAAEYAGRSEETRRVVGFCLLARREVVEAIGGLDERFGLGNFEDDDWCLRAYQSGWGARIAKDVFVHHTGSRTFEGEKIDFAASLRSNFEIFKKKWGMDPSAKLEDAYPFDRLAAGPRRPKVALPAPDRSRAEMGDRWFPDKRPAAANGSSSPDEPASKTYDAAPGKERIRVGVLPGGEPSPEVVALFARHGHSDSVPVVESAAVLERWLEEPGFVVLLGPDVLVTEDALEELVTVAKENPRLAAVGPVAAAAPKPQRIAGGASGEREMRRLAAKRRRRHRGKWQPAPYLGVFCLLLRPEAVRSAGGIDSTRAIPDALFDLFQRLRAAGQGVAVARGSWVHHAKLSTEEGAGFDERAAATGVGA